MDIELEQPTRRRLRLFAFLAAIALVITGAIVSFGPSEAVANTENASSPGEVVTIRVRGGSGEEEFHLRINGQVVESFVASTKWQKLSHEVPAGTVVVTAEVAFVNDIPGRDLQVDWLEHDGLRYQSEDSTTKATGTWADLCEVNVDSSSEWLRCNGWFRYPIGTPAGVARTPGPGAAPQSVLSEAIGGKRELRTLEDSYTTSADGIEVPTPLERPAPPSTQAPTTPPPTTAPPTTAPPTTTQPVSASVNGRYSIAQVIDGTIGAGDGSNPNEEAPMGRHDAALALPQGWNWTQGPTRNGVWGELGTGGSRFVEWRCAVIPEQGHTPDVPFRVNVRNGAYYQFANGEWNKAFDVDLTGGNHGGYLGQAGRENQNPFESGGHGQIEWRREADGSFSAPWNANALMMHFWAGQRQTPAPGQTAEFLTSELRLQQPDGQTVDLSSVSVLFQCGIDYYNTTGGQGTRVPGPGIAKYQFATEQWQPGLWVTLPGNAPAQSVGDFANWLGRNTPPNVG